MSRARFDHVVVVLVEFHSGGLVRERADEALRAGCSVVVADNSGTYRGPGIVIATGGNLGFGAACNRAVAALPADVDVIVLQNPDATITPGDLLVLVAAVRSGWAAVAPTLLTSTVRPFGFSHPQPLREIVVAGREVLRARGLLRAHGATASRPTDASMLGAGTSAAVVERPGRFGSAALVAMSRAAFDAVGGFDEDYFLYVEDLDLWRRLERGGHRVGFAPAVTATHAEAAGSSASLARRTALRWVAREYFAERHQPHRWRAYRLVHRVLMPALPADDPIVVAVRRNYSQRRHPRSILKHVRRIADRSISPPGLQRIQVGWSRARVYVAEGDRVLDVGSGAFPNRRADVLCERSPERPHRTAVVDRPFVVGDALALPFRDGAFDFVIASHLAEHVDAPDRFCAEISRVSVAGYLETPSQRFERLFPESNHLWRVRRTGEGAVCFEPNRTDGDVLAKLGRSLYRWYYAGQDKDRPSYGGTGPFGQIMVRVAYVVRGLANRSGITVTRVRFGPGAPLRCEVRRTG